MKYLLIIPLCILAVSKVTVQGGFSKKNIRKPVDALFFNALIFLSVAVLSAPILFGGISLNSLCWGAAFGVFSVMFQLFYSFALRYGSVSITVLTVNCSMILPVCVSAFLFHEPLTVCRIIGIVVILITFVLNANLTKGQKHSALWAVSVSMAFIATSGCSIVQKSFTVFAPDGSHAEFVAAAYLCAAVLSFLLVGIFYACGSGVSYAVKPRVWLTALSIGAVLFSFQLLNTYAVSRIDGTILYPVYNGGTTVLSAFVGMLFFHEKPGRKQVAGIVTGVIGIVLLCL